MTAAAQKQSSSIQDRIQVEVQRARALCERVGRPLATPTQAAALLGLPAR